MYLMTLFLYQNRFGGKKCYSMICSPMDPLQWMGAVRMRVQTADKNITINHKINPHDSSPSINLFKKLINPSLRCFKLLSIILLSPVKKSCLNPERNMHSLQENSLISVVFDVRGQQGMDSRKRCYGLWTRNLVIHSSLKVNCKWWTYFFYNHAAFHFTRR